MDKMQVIVSYMYYLVISGFIMSIIGCITYIGKALISEEMIDKVLSIMLSLIFAVLSIANVIWFVLLWNSK